MDTSGLHRILVVDDDPKIRTLLHTYFEDEGYRVVEAAGGTDMRHELGRGSFDVILLDVTLPGESGFDLAQEIRVQWHVPVIMVTGKGDIVDKVVGLELGAEDYITKPFHLREVLARVKNVIRRGASGAVNGHEPDRTAALNGGTIRFGRFELDPIAREVIAEDGTALDLTSSEFDLLRVFVDRPNLPLTRDELMHHLKGHACQSLDRSIDTQIGRLRKKIEADPKKPQLIKTVRGAGYVFAAKVEPAV